MSLQYVFDNLDDLIRTPEDVTRLNATILDLAVRGKLVPQDDNDEPVPDFVAVPQEEIPYEVPNGWIWYRLSDAAAYGTSRTAVASELHEDTWVLDLEDIEKTTSSLVRRVRLVERHFKSAKAVFARGDVLYGKLRPYLDKVLVADEPGVCSSEIVPIRPMSFLNPFYLRLVLKSPNHIKYVTERTYGVKMPRLGTKDAHNSLVPLPPLAEQQRIVAKVDELLAQTRALEANLRRAQEEIGVVNQSALHRLEKADDGESLHAAWRTISDAFDLLYDDPRPLAALRQTILQLAVRGKLVRQKKGDEPVDELMKRIGPHQNALGPSELMGRVHVEPYQVPAGWVWVRFDTAAKIATNGVDPATFGDLPHIAPDNIEKFTGRLLGFRTIREDGVTSVKHRFLPGQILYSKIRPNLSKAVVVDFEGLCSADMYPIAPQIESRYLHFYMLSSTFRGLTTVNDTRVAMPKINQDSLSKIPVPVPPLPEQQRIVAKVDELLGMCDALERKLGQSAILQRTAVESVLAHVAQGA